jgi:hypothetical protein
MSTNSTRRDFLIQTLAVAMLPGGIFAEVNDPRELLGDLLTAIIPESDGMPSAAGVGGVDYLEQLGWQYPQIGEDIEQFLGLVKKEISPGAFEKSSGGLGPERMVDALTVLERKAPDLFSKILAYIYEAYYGQPAVTGLMACPLPIEVGENDQALLAPVRAAGHLAREVP